jgi:hypothetical protein
MTIEAGPDEGLPILFDDADVYVLAGLLYPPADEHLLADIAKRPRATRAILFLSTLGGLARVAFRIVRALQHAYASQITVVIAGQCKSAGTLMVLGAQEIAMAGPAELGPLDVQILKDDEQEARQSGLVPTVAFNALSQSALSTFNDLFDDLKERSRLTTHTAAETAAALTVGLYAPIYEQVDPMRVAEVTLAQSVGFAYGQRLIRGAGDHCNVANDTLRNLVFGYPEHGFVIDRAEAKTMFRRVRSLNDHERTYVDKLRSVLQRPGNRPITMRVSATADEEEGCENETTTEEDEQNADHGSPLPVGGGSVGGDEEGVETAVGPDSTGSQDGKRRRRKVDSARAVKPKKTKD